MKALILSILTPIAIAAIYSLGWFALWLINSKWEFLDFTFAYFFSGAAALAVLWGGWRVLALIVCSIEMELKK